MLDTDHFIACTADRPNDFVEFQVQCTSVPILSVLDHKNDEKRDDRGRGIYDQLPGYLERLGCLYDAFFSSLTAFFPGAFASGCPWVRQRAQSAR